MFAVEIDFQDGASKPETAYVRRPYALIGGVDSSHVFIDDMKSLDYQFCIVRDVGRSFRCKRLFHDKSRDQDHETVYENTTTLNLGPVSLTLTALDADIVVRDTEPPDRAGVRILRQAASMRAPKFPAVLVLGNPQIVISFDKGQPLYIGRAKQCALRLDAPEVSAQHARIGFENGEFWIEDLGSTNGTFVNQQQVSGRVSVPPAIPIVLGRETSIMGISSEQQLRGIERSALGIVRVRPQMERKYPVLISVSEVARPARLVMPSSGVVQVGRDPTSDMWLGAPHISRMHCSLSLNEDGTVSVTDQSTNGTTYDDKILHKGDSAQFNSQSPVFDFGGGVTVALCFNESQEQAFISSQGSMSSVNRPAPQTASFDAASAKLGSGLIKQNLESGTRGTGNFLPMTKDGQPHDLLAPESFKNSLGNLYKAAGPQGKLVAVLVILAAFFILGISIALLRQLFG